MEKQEFKSYTEFFKNCGDNYLHPKQFNECIFPCTIEEIYIHFRNRMITELETEHGDLIQRR